MTEFGTMVVSGADVEEFSRSLTAVIQALPPDLRDRLHGIRTNYFVSYGFDGAYERMNNRTVSQFFAEYQPKVVPIIASGAVDGVRYQLYEAPPSHTTRSERGTKE